LRGARGKTPWHCANATVFPRHPVLDTGSIWLYWIPCRGTEWQEGKKKGRG